ncbi:glycolipid-anchored surface protein 5 precursor [Microthyrium microscopicum]|uniref:1,3-beta-glucanosyltransferase n=1 Tax=Microthyrium microscopicum TaxID=703497 RepID=A0A6A6UFD4_9PEZI|nr:glycolipid-anchored surface protein 5 precursor [Microthyrium microscopicum]
MKYQAIGAIFLLVSRGTYAFQKRDVVSNPKTPPVSVKGNAFFANNKRFYIRGVDYQPGGSSKVIDPLANPTICKRDIEKFKALGLNTIRIYSVDNSANHDECMKSLADAGIYLALDTNSPAYSINRKDEVSAHASYNEVYLQNVFATIDAFQKYDNTLLFYSANEVINEQPVTTYGAPYVKAVIRDMKNYIKARNYRKIPVGYSATDVTENRYETATYLNCGGSQARTDFFAFNDYSWCNSDFKTSGWDQKVEQYKDYSVPFFMSEYGCDKIRPRAFTEVEALYSRLMTPVYSGGLVYEYTQEPNGFGLVEIEGDQVRELKEFQIVQAAFKKTPLPADDGGYNPNGSPSKCPTKSANWLVRNSSTPLMPAGAQKYMQNGAGPGVGLRTGDKGSQWAGTPSTGWTEDKDADVDVVKNNTTAKSIGNVNFPRFGFLAVTICPNTRVLTSFLST